MGMAIQIQYSSERFSPASGSDPLSLFGTKKEEGRLNAQKMQGVWATPKCIHVCVQYCIQYRECCCYQIKKKPLKAGFCKMCNSIAGNGVVYGLAFSLTSH